MGPAMKRQTVDHLSPAPLYEQLAKIIRHEIEAGIFEPHDSLPSETSLQEQHEISRGTVRRALVVLRDQGLIITLPGRRSVVSGPKSARSSRSMSAERQEMTSRPTRTENVPAD
jgi:GntR family transcriptional regulator